MTELNRTVCAQNQCNGCMACINKCPKGCISILDDFESYNAFIDSSRCIKCGACRDVCPQVHKVIRKKPILWKQGWAADKFRENAASGGLATAIMRAFIEEGGYVSSCVFSNGAFHFELTNNINDIPRFAGSKYVKSDPGNIYRDIRERLKTHKVLFVGLPCQVAGLLNYIKDPQNLYTVDLICHGTPSPKLLSLFLKENQIAWETIEKIEFRKKNWWGLVINGNAINPVNVQDFYSYAFLDQLIFTENCYDCQFADVNRVSDITLGDSWSSELVNEKDKGISLILCQSEKGKWLLQKSNSTLYDVDIDDAICCNEQLKHPSNRTKARYRFFENINKGFEHSIALANPKIYIKKKIKVFFTVLGLLKNK